MQTATYLQRSRVKTGNLKYVIKYTINEMEENEYEETDVLSIVNYTVLIDITSFA